MEIGPFNFREVKTISELLESKNIQFEIADSDFVAAATDREKFGIVPRSDGSFELGEG